MISIPIDFDSEDDGYSVLKSKRMVHFLLDSIRQGNNLIQTIYTSSNKVMFTIKIIS